MTLLFLLALLTTHPPSTEAASPVVQSPSYVRIKGRRLKRFHKTEGQSENRRYLHLDLPATLLTKDTPKQLGRSRHWVLYRHKKVHYLVRRNDAYLRQALRKLDKRSGSPRLRIRGKVQRTRIAKDTFIYAVRVHEISVKGGTVRRRLPKSKKRRSTTQAPKASASPRRSLL